MLDAIAVACVAFAALFVLRQLFGKKKGSCGCGSSSGQCKSSGCGCSPSQDAQEQSCDCSSKK